MKYFSQIKSLNKRITKKNPRTIRSLAILAGLEVLLSTPALALNVEMTPIQNTMPLNTVVSPVPKAISTVPATPIGSMQSATGMTHSVSAQAITVSSQTFTLALPANPTTGYSWFIKSYDTNLLSVVGHRYVNQNNKMIGAGGTEMWTFHLNEQAFSAPHLILINMRYARPFDVNDGTDKVITVMTRVH